MSPNSAKVDIFLQLAYIYSCSAYFNLHLFCRQYQIIGQVRLKTEQPETHGQQRRRIRYTIVQNKFGKHAENTLHTMFKHTHTPQSTLTILRGVYVLWKRRKHLCKEQLFRSSAVIPALRLNFVNYTGHSIRYLFGSKLILFDSSSIVVKNIWFVRVYSAGLTACVKTCLKYN